MRSYFRILLAVMFFFPFFVAAQNYTQYVNPFVGTGAHGHTFPGAQVPFGAVQLSPDTRLSGWDGCSAYHYDDDVVYGFSHTHLSGTGCSDYGDVLVMPFTGVGSPSNSRYCSSFSHSSELAKPGYYAVTLANSGIRAELTATEHVGVHRYTFPDDGQEHGIVVDLAHRDIVLDSYMETFSKQEFGGCRISKAWNENQSLYFAMSLSVPVARIQYFRDTTLMRTISKLRGQSVKAVLYFPRDVREVVVKVGISPVDIDGAQANMVEVPGFDFDKVRNDADKSWNRELGKIEVKGSEADLRIFYTALYHCFISPYEYSDVDRRYRGMDGKIHYADNHKVYTVFSLWDTYRALHPLLNLIDRKRSSDFLSTFLLHYKQGGQLPMWELSAYETWCMIGYHAIPVILDASRKGIGNYDRALMLEAMVASSRLPKLGRPEFEQYQYVPADKEHESVSKTLEYCFDDWCIAQYAQDLGVKDVAEHYFQRSQYYKNILDADGFMHPRSNGAFMEPFAPGEVNNHFTEANSWQYSTYVPHDFNTYVQLAGGERRVTAMLDSLFFASVPMTGRQQADLTGIIGQYAHGNEPGHHAPYMFNYVGQPWKTQQVTRRIMRELYADAPDGLCGNEDCGQMSAWYVMSAMGFYAVSPGSNQYDWGSPLFDEVKIHLENGRTFTIICKNQSPQNCYIQSMKHNGKPYSSVYLTYDMIQNGDTFEIEMGPAPAKSFGAKPENRINSVVAPSLVLAPVFETQEQVFRDQLSITIHPAHLQKGEQATICYTTSADGFNKVYTYKKPVVIKKSTVFRAWVQNGSGEKSAVVEASYHKFVQDKAVFIKSQYNPQYTAGGDEGLIDGLRGSVNWRLGGWQGYQGQDFEAVVDLKGVRDIHRVAVGFLADVRAWICFPVKLVVEVSADGSKFVPFGEFSSPYPDNDYTVRAEDFVVNGSAKARYVRVRAINYGVLPEWHLGAGGDAYIFTDEIVIQ